jgi:hypothetical protein
VPLAWSWWPPPCLRQRAPTGACAAALRASRPATGSTTGSSSSTLALQLVGQHKLPVSWLGLGQQPAWHLLLRGAAAQLPIMRAALSLFARPHDTLARHPRNTRVAQTLAPLSHPTARTWTPWRCPARPGRKRKLARSWHAQRAPQGFSLGVVEALHCSLSVVTVPALYRSNTPQRLRGTITSSQYQSGRFWGPEDFGAL